MAAATSVIWAEQDEWKKQYKMVNNSASEHNKRFEDLLRERSGCDSLDVSTFMDQHPSTRGEQETPCIEAFCQGAYMVLHEPDSILIRDHQVTDIEEPRAWVSDRNYWLLKDDATGAPLYGNALGRIEFYKVLQNEVCTISSINRG
jgi:hypothetical protein